MSRLPDALVHRLDRASRRAHRHHTFAHHPLCVAYRDELVHVGRYRICRGCAAAALGIASGLVLGAMVPIISIEVISAVALVGGGIGLLSLARRLPLRGKLMTRALPASAAGFVAANTLARGDALGVSIALATPAVVFAGVALYKRRGPWRSACATCPERSLSPCSGYQLAWRRERAFQRLAARWIRAGGL